MSGTPDYLYDQTNPDWLPTLHLGHGKKRLSSGSIDRRARKKAREETVKALEDGNVETNEAEEAAEALISLDNTASVAPHELQRQLDEKQGVISDLTLRYHDLQRQLDEKQGVISDLTLRITHTVAPFSAESLKIDEIVKFYTGLPNMKVFKAVFNFVEKSVQNLNTCKLSPVQEVLCTVIKRRLNCKVQDLVYRFNVSCATVSRVFLKWIKAMDQCLRHLILWPDRETLQKRNASEPHLGQKLQLSLTVLKFLLSAHLTFKLGRLHGHLTNIIIPSRSYLG